MVGSEIDWRRTVLRVVMYLVGAVPNAPDGLVQVISESLQKRFGDVKVVFDTSHVTASLIMSLLVLHELGGFGATTIISALFLGRVINVVNSLFVKWFRRAAFGTELWRPFSDAAKTVHGGHRYRSLQIVRP